MNDTAIDELEKRGFVVFSADMECCLWAYHDRLRETHALKSSFWRTPSGQEMETAELLEYVGANKTSTDVHWSLSFSLRPKHLKNFRKRGKEALQRRLQKKTERGYRQGSPGRAASSSQSNWWSSSDWSGWGGWWSGSSSWSGWWWR